MNSIWTTASYTYLPPEFDYPEKATVSDYFSHCTEAIDMRVVVVEDKLPF